MRAILTYHSIDETGSPISIAPDVFERQLRWLASGPVAVLPLTELWAAGETPDAVALTFDDAFANFATEAWPRLRECGLPATVYAVTGRVGGTNGWRAPGMPAVPELPLMDWDQLGKLAADGVDVASHTRTHVDLTASHPDRCREEIEGSAETIHERLGVAPTSFAYPYGRFNPALARSVQARYSLGCTTEFRWLAAEHRSTLPRLDMYYFQRSGQLERFGSARFRRRVGLRNAIRRMRERVSSGLKPR